MLQVHGTVIWGHICTYYLNIKGKVIKVVDDNKI